MFELDNRCVGRAHGSSNVETHRIVASRIGPSELEIAGPLRDGSDDCVLKDMLRKRVRRVWSVWKEGNASSLERKILTFGYELPEDTR